jgi:hypothetical protein
MVTYGSSPVKRRSRAELAAVDDAITAAVAADSPVTRCPARPPCSPSRARCAPPSRAST